MSIGSILNTATAGMSAQQLAIQIASQNISNAETPGYSKQTANLQATLPTVFPYGSVGTGVAVTSITRSRDTMLDATYRTANSAQSQASTTSSAMDQIQSVLGEPSDTGLSSSLDAFWSAWDNLANNPTDSSAKSVVLQTGGNVASTLNNMARQLDALDQNNRDAMNAGVNQANALTQQIAAYNKQIVAAEAGGQTANDLRDARDNLCDQLAGLVGGQIINRANGSIGVYVGGRLVVDGASATPFQMNDGQPPYVSFVGSTEPLTGIAGSLGAEIDLSTNRIPSVISRLDSVASTLVQSVNSVHSTGTTFTGTPPVSGQAGNFFAVTNPPPAGADPYLTARGIKLDPGMTDASKVAASGAAAAGPGDNATATALATLRSAAVSITDPTGATVGSDSISTWYQSLVGDVATQTSQADDDSTVQSTLASNADQRRQSVSGVSTDEELVSVIEHQHAYQAAARLVTTVNDMLDTLLNIGQ